MQQACSLEQVLSKSQSFHMVKSWQLGLGKKKQKKTHKKRLNSYRASRDWNKIRLNHPKPGVFRHFLRSKRTQPL